LILRTAGTPSIEWYLSGGTRAAETIRDVLSTHGVDIYRTPSVLDFGCGAGRVVRHWSTASGQIHGCDYDAPSVDWCRRHLEFARFERNALRPPLGYPGERFTVVYAMSVFTHLPQPLQTAWMSELRRVLAPSGLLVFSTHGASYLAELDASERTAFESGALVVRAPESPGSNICGAYHPTSYVRKVLAAGFDTLGFTPEGALGNPHQDLYVFRKVGNWGGRIS
jgi:SAM-dependent methyltransferase